MKQAFFLNRFLMLLLSSMCLFSSCKNSGPEPEPEDEKEVITTVRIQLVPEGKGQNAAATWKDLDGPDGQGPLVENLVLKANTTYRGTLTILNESNPNAPIDLTAEIRAEGYNHDVFYIVDGASLSIQKTDLDRNNRAIGLETTAATTSPSTGTLRVVLKHQPGLKSGSSNIDTGETDIDITFPVFIQD
ncbi:hypothetical protein ACMA1I_19125 [Pontibacter sp. 13R65]|uniref:hypothetical protein n=1 Tax=Pontibacter sp. 13R65 TaxID=3127458 RepID=UPI00301CA3DA